MSKNGQSNENGQSNAVAIPQMELGLPELIAPNGALAAVYRADETWNAEGERTGEKLTLRKREDIARLLGLTAKDKDELDSRVQMARDEIKTLISQLMHKLESDPQWTGGNLRTNKSKPNKQGVVTRRIYASLQTVVRGIGPSDEAIAKAWSERTGIKITAERIAEMRAEQLAKLERQTVDVPPVPEEPGSNKPESELTDEELEAATRPEVEV